MHRRTCLQSVGAALGVALAGCSDVADSRTGNGRAESEPRAIQVRAAPPATADREFRTELRVEWAYRGADIIRPDEAKWQFPRGDRQHVVCQFRVENVGDRAVRVAPEMFQLASYAGEAVFAPKDIDDPDQFPERRLDPGDVATGWAVYAVVHMREVFLLALDQDEFPRPVDATFERTDLAFTLENDDTGTTAPGETTAREVV